MLWTWAEIKAAIEKAGVKDDTKIVWIDISGYDRGVDVRFDEHGDAEIA